jgi:hypothetical protein
LKGKNMRNTDFFIIAVAALFTLVSAFAEARSDKSSGHMSGSRNWGEIHARDRASHKAAVVKPLARERVVERYTSASRAASEQRKGIAPGSHTTSTLHRGRALTSEKATHRYGLKRDPEVKETIRIPAGQPVRITKVIGGKPGYGEITSTRPISPKNIMKVTPVRSSSNKQPRPKGRGINSVFG